MSYAEMADGKIVDISKVKQKSNRYEEIGNRGFRILGICYRKMIEYITIGYNTHFLLLPRMTRLI